ncbi:hypothetical protein I6N95_24810 [Vagococcus sp. BWB3-3]|uniref:Resolvase/invertase-type recombinase catalytic domain-containing protein n=1 Tax=Vagococcus allomyrinae TaxID=2794353 RepID=A0A940SXE2_9ENTE|nr:hypothetical protein [Vagococcus allomyrinae]MBP1044235.1 hypothetical protein [Vagococcus allomyrinae]
MKIGYFRVKESEKIHPYQVRLKKRGAQLFFYDVVNKSRISWQSCSQLRDALDMGKVDDTILLSQLEDISHQPEEWLSFLDDLIARGLNLEVLDYPTLQLADWAQLMKWMQEIPQQVKGDIKIIGIQPESQEERQLYRGLSSVPEARQTYWQVFSELVSNRSIRRTARRYGISRGTAYRISKQVQQVKHILWLVGTFLITMLGLQIARHYTDSFFLQFGIGLIATVSIILFTYSDMKED